MERPWNGGLDFGVQVNDGAAPGGVPFPPFQTHEVVP